MPKVLEGCNRISLGITIAVSHMRLDFTHKRDSHEEDTITSHEQQIQSGFAMTEPPWNMPNNHFAAVEILKYALPGFFMLEVRESLAMDPLRTPSQLKQAESLYLKLLLGRMDNSVPCCVMLLEQNDT